MHYLWALLPLLLFIIFFLFFSFILSFFFLLESRKLSYFLVINCFLAILVALGYDTHTYIHTYVARSCRRVLRQMRFHITYLMGVLVLMVLVMLVSASAAGGPAAPLQVSPEEEPRGRLKREEERLCGHAHLAARGDPQDLHAFPIVEEVAPAEKAAPLSSNISLHEPQLRAPHAELMATAGKEDSSSRWPRQCFTSIFIHILSINLYISHLFSEGSLSRCASFFPLGGAVA
eukprot:gene2295-1435_t